MVDVTNGKEAYKVMEKAQAEGRKELFIFKQSCLTFLFIGVDDMKLFI